MNKLLRAIVCCGLLLTANICLAKLSTEITGVSKAIEANITAKLSLSSLVDSTDLSADEVERLFKRADKEIRAAIAPFGYYNSDIVANLSDTNGEYRASFAITLGQPIRVKTINYRVVGPGRSNTVIARSKLSFKPGAVLDQPKYEADKDKILQQATEASYLAARFSTAQILIDRENYSAVINLTLDTGPAYFFGPVSFNQEYFSDTFLNRFVTFDVGDPYLAPRLAQLQQDFNRTNYFQFVEINSDFETTGTQVPITITLNKNPPNLYQAAIGYGTDTKLRGRLSWERRYLNRHGHKLFLQAKASDVQNDINAHYIVPGKLPAYDFYKISARQVNEDIAERRSSKTTAALQQNIRRGNWQRQVGIDLSQERFREGQALASNDINLLMPNFNLIYERKDDNLNPRDGIFGKLELRGASSSLLSSTSFVQAKLIGKMLQPVSSQGLVLLKGATGITAAEKFDDLPLSLRFFTGGDNTVRGYAYKSIGPRGQNGVGQDIILGGKFLIEASAEYEHILYKKFSGAVFVDGGNASNNISTHLETAAGFGLRWRSPVGPIKLDFAFPFAETNDGMRIHIRFGPEF